jgi:hypothetical protein
MRTYRAYLPRVRSQLLTGEISQLAGTCQKLRPFKLIHAYVLTPSGVQNNFGFGAAKAYAVAYLIAALLLVALHFYNRGRESENTGIVA